MPCKELLSTENVPIRVIYPGRTNGDSGPDIRDAVIANDSDLAKGDIEIHVRSSEWYGHGHHTDPEYNDVVLHVVMWHDCKWPTLQQNGQLVPVLSLATALQHQPYLLPHQLPCFQILDRMDRQSLKKLLNAAGEERFHQKVARFQARISRFTSMEEAGQVLFRGIMRALGYIKNTKPFEDLSDRMPLSFIESKRDRSLKQALLLGAAGLLPSQRRRGHAGRSIPTPAHRNEIRRLEQLWQSSGRKCRSMTEGDWRLSHIYPNNSPVRRIIAQSYLLDRYREEGLLSGVLRLVKEAPSSKGHRVLEDGLIVSAEGYWQNHFDFGVTANTKISVLLGAGKAGEIIANVVLPFAFSWGESINQAVLTHNAIDFYHSHPKLAENRLTQHMRRQLSLEDSSDFAACHQQGLIHIFNGYCREGKCERCPLID